MTTVIGGVTLGMLVGYVATAVISSYTNWRWSFYLQIIFAIPVLISIFAIRQEFINVSQDAFKKKPRINPV